MSHDNQAHEGGQRPSCRGGAGGVFVQAYMANGHNATQAAIAAGYSARTAYSQGQRLLKHVETRRQLAEAARALAKKVELDTDRTLREVARIAYSDPRRLFREDGTLIPMHELPEDVSAAVASCDAEGGRFKIKLAQGRSTEPRHEARWPV